MPRHFLRAEELNKYQQTGFLLRTNEFGSQEVSILAAAAEAAAQRAKQDSEQGTTYHLDGNRFVDTPNCTVQFEHQENSTALRVVEPIHHLHTALDQLVDDRRLIDPMQSILAVDKLSLWTTKFNLKGPGGSGFGWHQDSPYWIHTHAQVDLLPNVMFVLDDQTQANGCFRVVPGSHRRGILPGASDGKQLSGFFTHPNEFDTTTVAPLEAPAGSLIFFDPHIVHGSEPNPSNMTRRALVYTYQPGTARLLKHDSRREVSS